MHRLIYTLAMLWLAGTIAGCASMSKKDCETADWHTIGYNDGARGIHYSNLDSYRKRCSDYQIAPDTNAYMAGWNQGIRSYCTSDNGYLAGVAGQALQNFCPPDLAPGYLAGWQQGVQQYCTPDNGFRQGLAGYPYRGVCPAHIADGFQLNYRLGLDLRQARNSHNQIEYQLDRVRKNLSTEKDEHRYHDLLEDLSHLRREEESSESRVGALEACASDDWFQVGLSDGESGNSYRAPQIADLCRDYGGGEDMQGYREGWTRGNSHYCSYDSGLYAGQNNQEYRGVCNGPVYGLFWSGYLRGIQLFKAGRYEDHPRPQFQHEERHQPEERHMQQERNREQAPGHGNASQPAAAHGDKQEQQVRHGTGSYPNPSDQQSNNKPAPANVQHAPAKVKPAPVKPEPAGNRVNKKPAGRSGNNKPKGKADNRKPEDKQNSDQSDRKHAAKPDQRDNGKPADEQHTGDEHGASSRSE